MTVTSVSYPAIVLIFILTLSSCSAANRHQESLNQNNTVSFSQQQIPVVSQASQDYKQLRTTLNRLMNWFESSGILPNEDGSGGIYERFILDAKDVRQFRIAKHIRADCTLQSGLLFALYGNMVSSNKWKERSRKMFLYPLRNLQDLSPESHTYGLLTWSNEHPDTYWTDDNSWCVVLLLKAYELTGEKEYLEKGLLCAEALLRKTDFLIGFDTNDSSHRGAFYTMAMAYAYLFTHDNRFLEPPRDYVARRLKDQIWKTAKNTPHLTNGSAGPTSAMLAVSIYYYATKDPNAKRLLDQLGTFLIESRGEEGGLYCSWEWWLKNIPLENSKPYVDLVYGHNFACLAFYHAYLATEEVRYKQAFLHALGFLGKIQIQSEHVWLNGAWRGAYDPVNKRYDGPEIVSGEGGPLSIYSGWTHAPIGLALVFALTGDSFIPSNSLLAQKRNEIQLALEHTQDWLEKANSVLEEAIAKKKEQLIRNGLRAATEQRNLAFGKSYQTIPPITGGRYFDDTGIKLTDGLFVEAHFFEYRTLNWLHKNEVEIVLDLEQPEKISKVVFSSLGDGYGGCEYPNAARLYGSNDKSAWSFLGDFTKETPRFVRNYGEHTLSASLFTSPVETDSPYRYVKIWINHRDKPDLHIDEIQVIGK